MARDLDSLPPRRLSLTGPAGRLAATLEEPRAVPRGALLLLHPHPLHGGTRRSNVVRYGALGALQAGCAALRFDFRGAGDSEGSHAGGVGELEDARAAFDWLARRHPGLPLFLWGFSFGARVGLQLAVELGPQVAGYLGVAWPTSAYPGPAEHDPAGLAWPWPAAFLAGDQDPYVDLAVLRAVTARGARLVVVPGADHFFTGALSRVQSCTAAALSAWLAR